MSEMTKAEYERLTKLYKATKEDPADLGVVPSWEQDEEETQADEDE